MDKKYLLLIVNYKKNILETETINSILNLEYNDFDVVVWDNLALYDNERKIKTHNDKINFIYLPSSENSPLSVIYNEVIVNILEKGNYQYFVILDNDTSVDDKYFISHLSAEKKENNVNLFLPQVFNNEQLVSPGYMYGFKGGYLKHYTIGLNDAKNKTAINSGMIIRAKYIKEYNIRYNTKIKFYGTDDNFMISYQKLNKSFFLMDYVIRHDLSMFNKKESREIKLWRLNEQVRGLYYNCNSIFSRTTVIFYIGILYLRFFMTHKK